MSRWDLLKAFTERLFEQHRFVRRSLIFGWSAVGIWISLHLFVFNTETITTPVSIAYGSLTVFLAAILTFYTTSRGRDDR